MQNDIRLYSLEPSDIMPSDIMPSDIMPSDIMPSDIWPNDIRPNCTAPFFAWKPILRKIYNPSQQIKAKEKFFLPIFSEFFYQIFYLAHCYKTYLVQLSLLSCKPAHL